MNVEIDDVFNVLDLEFDLLGASVPAVKYDHRQPAAANRSGRHLTTSEVADFYLLADHCVAQRVFCVCRPWVVRSRTSFFFCFPQMIAFYRQLLG